MPDGIRVTAHACRADGGRVAVAIQLDLPDGRRVWAPPRGAPFWASNLAAVDFDAEGLGPVGELLDRARRLVDRGGPTEQDPPPPENQAL